MTQNREKERNLFDGPVRNLIQQASETSMEFHDLTEEVQGDSLRIFDVARKSYYKHDDLVQTKTELFRNKELMN
ncbi:MAG: CCE_0567 family metalloprotein [Leptospirales bacterium]